MTKVKSIDVKDIIKQLRNEAIKEYREYDASFRPTSIYQAVTKAKNGDACLRTEYVYDGSSKRITKKRETVVEWQSAWDI